MHSIEIPQPNERGKKYRAFEILPGALSWTILFLPIVLGIFSARLTAYFVIAYLLLWFVRTIGLTIRSIQGWNQMNIHKNLPWQSLNDDLENLRAQTKDAPKWHKRNLERVEKYMLQTRVKPSEVIHAIIVATWNESKEILEPTIQSVLGSDYDMKKVVVFLAYEERGGPEVEKRAKQLMADYKGKFMHAEAAKHIDQPGEVIGKGGNITNAGRELKKYLEKEGIDFKRVLVTTLDADNRPDKEYFQALTYTFCSTEEPKHVSYQPIPMFLNNIWDAPAPMRVVATGNSFWNIILSMRPHMLRNFSSHAQPMEALIDTDFWSVRTIVEDGHQYWRTFFRYDGQHDVYPIFVPIYQDAVLTDSYKRTLKAQFIQVRRWAWGASDIAYFAYMGFMRKNKIPRPLLIARFGRLLEGHISWSTAPLILLLAAYPPFLFNPDSYLANQLPQVASQMQRIAMVGILASLYLSMRALPPKPARYKHRRTFWMVLQWVYLPITTIVYSSMAAINSQTRLMFGWYLGKFDLTEKAVKSDRPDISAL
jgi:cellulose synthase/poly-beta-1,6-N-acetylglucosamine synthase-like glycosyltransferase